MKIDNNLVKDIVDFLSDIEKEYQENQGLILTEDDLKCLLFSKLYGHFPKGKTIDKGISASFIHSEVKFYDENGQLTLRPDLCIIDTIHLSIFHSVEFKVQRSGNNHEYKSYPKKCFEIGGNTIIIELKFCRDKNGISDADIISYNEDISKIKLLQEIVNRRSTGIDKMYGIFAVFNKTNEGYENFKPILEKNKNNDKISIFYGSGLADFNVEHRFPDNSGYLTERNAWC